MKLALGLSVLLILVLVAGIAIYIRVAGDDVARWHVQPEPALAVPIAAGVVEIPRGAVLRIAGGAGGLVRLATVAAQTPRTTLLAGSVDRGRMTWVTRSALWSFPDYTTAQILPDGSVAVWARQRYGKGDHGVNAARLRIWTGE